MTDVIEIKGTPDAHVLSELEQKDIENKVKIQGTNALYYAVKLGAVTNFLSGLFFVWILYGQIKPILLVTWYLILVSLNIVNTAFCSYFQYHKNETASWRIGLYVMLALMGITWGCIDILVAAGNIHYQIYTLAFLFAVIVGFSFGSVTDFTAAMISIIALVTPPIIFHAYLWSAAILSVGYDPNLNMGIAVSFFITGAFLFVACYSANRMITRFFRISYINEALSNKLNNMNKLLEVRVSERTAELENSLKLVRYQATHDLLTDLPNQRLLEKYIDNSINNAIVNKTMFAVAFFSLNEIEKIDDGLGHEISAVVIQTIADRFKRKFSDIENSDLKNTNFTITLSRKDEFVILFDPVLSLDEIEMMAYNFLSVLESPIYTKKQQLSLTASIGVSVYPRDGKDVKSLLMNSDAAMLHAKRLGGNSLYIYQSDINAERSKQLEIESNLLSALKHNEFRLQYQPVVDLKTGHIVGSEALIRWQSPKLGFISPMDFIMLAEANGTIIPIGEWVLRTACAQLKKWHDLGFTELTIAVNLSAKQLRQKNIVQILTSILDEYNLQSKCLELELTETEAFKEEAIPILKAIKANGISLSVDDFGTGYSGLKNLKLFSIDKLKIDKSFVDDINVNDDSNAIVSNTIALAKKINITVIAEGVETEEQLNYLVQNDCDMLQGYYFSKPVNPEDFTHMLVSGRSLLLPKILDQLPDYKANI